MNENNYIEKFTEFKHELAIAETYEEIKRLENKTEAVADLAKKEGLVKSQLDEWGEYWVQVVAKKGAWLDEFFPSRVRAKDRKSSVRETRTDKMPATPDESAQARTINEEEKLVKEAIKKLKKDKKKIVTPNTVKTIIDKEKKKEKEKDPNYLKKKKEEEITRYFADTNTALNKALDRVTYIMQGDYIPQDKKDFAHIVGIRNNLYAAIRLSIQAGIDVPKVWETYHGKVEIAKHLNELKNESIEEADIIP
jgi:hypothetical protein